MSSWRLEIAFPRQVFQLAIEGCDAEVEEKTRVAYDGEQKGTTYALTPGPTSSRLEAGSELQITLIGRTWKRQRGFKRSVTATFFPPDMPEHNPICPGLP